MRFIKTFTRLIPTGIAVDAEGRPRKHWITPELWVTCTYGPYTFEYMPQILREIMSGYMVDGVFANRWQGSGMCFCEHCRRSFKAFSGMDIPRRDTKEIVNLDWSIEPKDPAWRAYAVWRRDKLFALWDLWDAELRKINPHSHFIPNMGADMRKVLDMKTFGERADYLTADHQARNGISPPWAVGLAGKEFRAVLNHKPLGAGYSVGPYAKYRWIDSVQSDAELKVWAVEGIANGVRLSFGKTGAIVYDKRWMKPIEELFDWHYRSEKYLRNEEPLARIVMVFSQQTVIYYGAKVEDHTFGMYQALIEARIPFEMVHDGLLDSDHTDKFKLLILLNIAALSDKQCDQLRGYVKRGGSILATYETSLYDEWGTKRANFGLSDLFGVRCKGQPKGPVSNSFMRFENDAGTRRRHPLLDGFDGAERIINSVYYLEVEGLRKRERQPRIDSLKILL